MCENAARAAAAVMSDCCVAVKFLPDKRLI